MVYSSSDNVESEIRSYFPSSKLTAGWNKFAIVLSDFVILTLQKDSGVKAQHIQKMKILLDNQTSLNWTATLNKIYSYGFKGV